MAMKSKKYISDKEIIISEPDFSSDFQSCFESKEKAVIKIGTQVLLDDEQRLSISSFKRICDFAYSLIQKHKQIILVSSGAIAAGKQLLNIRPVRNDYTIKEKQAFAACGQPVLMKNYGDCFEKYGVKTAQILLTKDDISVKERFENARNTIGELLKNGIVPIINENDTVSYEEIKFSDNDYLSALVSNLIKADILVVLSNVKGVYDKNPLTHKDAKPIAKIEDIAGFVKNFNDSSKSLHGTGGMKSKLHAAFMASEKGIDTVIVSGKDKKDLSALSNGVLNGTFIASGADRSSYKKCS